jgi:hypothetical protein
MAADENRASTSVLANDDGVTWRRNLVEGIVFAGCVTSLGLLLGNPRSWSSRSDDGVASVATPLVGIIFGVDIGRSGAALWETPDLGLPAWMMATGHTICSLGAFCFKQSLARGGSEVEWRVPSRIDDGGSRRRGAAESQRMLRIVLYAQEEEEPAGAVVASTSSLVRGFSFF